MSRLLTLISVLLFSQFSGAEPLVGRVLLEKMPTEIHILRSVSLEAVLIDNQVYDTLVRIASSGEVEPVLIESWKYDAAKRTFAFVLKKNILFSNGTPLTSEIVAKALNRVIKSKRVQSLSRIKGADAVIKGSASNASGIKIQNSHEFSIQLEVAYPRFLVELSDPYAAIFLDVPNSLPLGTGVYQIENVSAERNEVTLTRNLYAPKQPRSFDKVVFALDPSDGVDVSFVDLPSEKTKGMKQVHYLDTEVVFLGFNSENPILKDKNVRASLASLLSPEMVDATIGPAKYQVGGYIPFGMAGHDPTLHNPPPTTKVLPKKIVISNYLTKLKPLAESYCQKIRDNGVGCSIKHESDEELIKEKAAGTLQVFFLRQKSTTYSVDYLLSCMKSQSECNLFLPPKEKFFDHLFDSLWAMSADQPKRILEVHRQIDREILERVLLKPIRYGANKPLWYREGLKMPALSTLGPFGLKIEDIREMN